MYSTQNGIVTIFTYGIGTFYGLLIALEGHRSLAHVAIGTAEEVVGTDLLVGRAVAVVVVSHFLEDGVGGQGVVALVAGIGQQQIVVHTVSLIREAHAAKQREGRVGTRQQQAVHCHELRLSAGARTPGKQQQREEYVGEFLHLRILLSFAKVVQIERNTKLIQLIFKSEMQLFKPKVHFHLNENDNHNLNHYMNVEGS